MLDHDTSDLCVSQAPPGVKNLHKNEKEGHPNSTNSDAPI